jgi:hypothetical protein
MRFFFLPTLMIACYFSSFASAWCSVGIASCVGVGVGVGGVTCSGGGGDRFAYPSRMPRHSNENYYDPNSKLRRRQHPRDDCKIHSPRKRPIGVFNLRSKANDDDDNRTDGGQMTPAKASKLLSTFWSMAYPYYHESKPGRRLFYGMILLTLVNSAVSVAFSYISKDFWNALSSKDVAEFYTMMIKFAGALIVGAPVSVLYR